MATKQLSASANKMAVLGKTTPEKMQQKTKGLPQIAPVIKNENIENTAVMVEIKQSEKKSVLRVNQKVDTKNSDTAEAQAKKDNVVPDDVQTALVVEPVTAPVTMPTLLATKTPVVKQKLKALMTYAHDSIMQ